ncbi:intraflagellar transporter 172 [Thecamonas trahens ATCC 50062]|uniref:Intraflagellar transporter 172 n=1 Tax=Thecamonas trahens ATCC 50062 TaxID=461836 RepID=A0A0L0DTH5_THETB|nr:intraflagellar transporter 172 [Thecamonas trahens ATCC 50062]KNC55624.1 intraflagellar transporter 172 [Thecamonas trahens ATCC 50062]|eukprot:XP_013761397.1 intraflagellar transporter 172 [Thecamonas trahens ATCC 50062]
MHLRHVTTLAGSKKRDHRVDALAFAGNNMRLAAATADRVVHLFDPASGERKDKFATKPGGGKGAAKSYKVVAMAFSPDSTKLAIAQSDSTVFVYKLGAEWGASKAICNKFAAAAPLTALVWPALRPNELLFGDASGAVKVGNLKRKKAAPLYDTDSPLVAAAPGPSGHSAVFAHLDGTLFVFEFDHDGAPASHFKASVAPAVPLSVGWGSSILVPASDNKVYCLTADNPPATSQVPLDFSRDPSYGPLTTLAVSPSGAAAVLGSYSAIYLLTWSPARSRWVIAGTKPASGMGALSSFAWSPSGSRLVAGSAPGCMEMFDAALKRARYRGQFEFTYLAANQVLVKPLLASSAIPESAASDGVLVKAERGPEIEKINIFQGRYLIATTPTSLLAADLGRLAFYFDNPSVCMIFNAGELTLVQYGVSVPLATVRTEVVNPHRLSICVPSQLAATPAKLAYLLDPFTISVSTLASDAYDAAAVSITHDKKVDWLELSRNGDYLLFRDKTKFLYLVFLEAGSGNASRESVAAADAGPGAHAPGDKVTLLSYCSYVQWVPFSDVVVAQSRSTLHVWYSVASPSSCETFPIAGDVDSIVRADGTTYVAVDDGFNTSQVVLDEGLIEFGAALQDSDFGRAIAMLEVLDPASPQAAGMWATLGSLALEAGNLVVAHRCYAATGDVAKAAYLKDVLALARASVDGASHYAVQARLLVLRGTPREAESLLLRYGGEAGVQEAMRMWQGLHKHGEALRVAREGNFPGLATYKEEYFGWLMETAQFGEAAKFKADEGEFADAIALYLQGSLPARAASLVTERGLDVSADVLERIGTALFNSRNYSKAGEFFERLGKSDRALDAYRQGGAYGNAVALARRVTPGSVTGLEEEWGDYLVNAKNYDSAVNHYVEAGAYVKALEAAMKARLYTKALSLLNSLPADSATGYALKLAAHFDEVGEYESAETLYMRCDQPRSVVEMYTRAGRFADVSRLAGHLEPGELASLYLDQAGKLHAAGKLADAERMYIEADEPDSAIQMYKQAARYDDMIRLVSVFHKDLLLDTHLHLAQQLESESRLGEAEKHYLAGQDPKAAINMYRAASRWDDAYRVAREAAPQAIANQIAYYWIKAEQLPSSIVGKLGLAPPAVAYAMDSGEWEMATELAHEHSARHPALLGQVHIKRAYVLEDANNLAEAETHFIAAGRPREAILMYAHAHDWAAATRVARENDPSAMKDIFVAQAKDAAERGDLEAAEKLYLRVERPELAIEMFVEAGDWPSALRVARVHTPHELGEVQARYERSLQSAGSASKEGVLEQASVWVDQGEYSKAIDTYLGLSPDEVADHDFLEETWERHLVPLAIKFVPDRVAEVVTKVSTMLVDMGRVQVAADLYAEVEMYKEALDVLMSAEMFDRAVDLAARRAPGFSDYVAAEKRAWLVNRGDASSLLAEGDTRAGLEVLASQGEWERVLSTADSLRDPELLTGYTTRYVSQLLESGSESRFVEAVRVYARYPPLALAQHMPLFARLAKEVLSGMELDVVSELKTFLYALEAGALEQYLLLAHLLKGDASQLLVRLSFALLRYAHVLPADRLFYEAGAAAIKAGSVASAFVAWNRFVDIADAMRDGELVGDTLFDETDVPRDLFIPEESAAFVPHAEVERIRNWVIEKGMEEVEGKLDGSPCARCGAFKWAGGLVCTACGDAGSDVCIVTGEAVGASGASGKACNACGMLAAADAWNAWIRVGGGSCAWCGERVSLNWQ